MSEGKVSETGKEKIERVGEMLANVLNGYLPDGPEKDACIAKASEVITLAGAAIDGADGDEKPKKSKKS